MMEAIWNNFDRVVVFDTETTGIEFARDRIIELGAVSLEQGVETDCMDLFIRLPEGRTIPSFITELTGITDEQLLSEGVDQKEAAEAFCRLLEGAERPLLVAYNAQFDLNFLFWFLRPYGRVEVLRAPRFLDALTVYRDRRDYPHKLCNAIEAYSLGDRVVNSHRAVDDARATVELLEAMAAEQDDLERYLDLFGIHPKYGMSGRKISSVTYRPQSYRRTVPLYELT
ncbi:3'-5' exonuclease [Dysosmobacter sp.]|uniref:3'-5' exonuclease n=1 Tax=Dysosmobacter sp. TaxID=2591382 RepID=UPI002A95F89C|nr:3'-5' exonuclease [Dysosmobacter sp.]MDY5612421.1 3'-5' exonuclease [Dysosmobacter sp.]